MGSFLIQEGCAPDTINGAKYVRDLYEKVSSSFQKYTVPVLWDKKTSTIVNNESSDILRMFNTVFSEFATGPMANHDFYPEALRAEIDSVNDWVYPDINDGVYKCGFAKSQAAYNDAVNNLYNSLERVESILSTSRYLVSCSTIIEG